MPSRSRVKRGDRLGLSRGSRESATLCPSRWSSRMSIDFLPLSCSTALHSWSWNSLPRKLLSRASRLPDGTRVAGTGLCRLPLGSATMCSSGCSISCGSSSSSLSSSGSMGTSLCSRCRCSRSLLADAIMKRASSSTFGSLLSMPASSESSAGPPLLLDCFLDVESPSAVT